MVFVKNWSYAMVVFLGGCSYGVLSTFVKLAYGAGFEMPEVVGSQFLFGACLIWLLVLFRRKKITKITRSSFIKLLIAGTPSGLTGIFYYKSLMSTDASLAIIFLFQFIWIGTLLEWIFYKHIPSRNKVISIIILLFGSILAAGVIGLDSFSWIGLGWGLLAAVTFSIFILVSGAVEKQTSAVLKSAIFSLGAFILVSILFPPMFLFDTEQLFSLAPYGLLLGFFGVLLPPLLFSFGMPVVGPSLGTILSASELPVAVIMSAIILKETITAWQWVGVICILLGIIIGNGQILLKRKQARM